MSTRIAFASDGAGTGTGTGTETMPTVDLLPPVALRVPSFRPPNAHTHPRDLLDLKPFLVALLGLTGAAEYPKHVSPNNPLEELGHVMHGSHVVTTCSMG